MPTELIPAIPFVLLLGSIAIIPLINKHWWEHYYPHIALSLGAITTAYYLLGLKHHEPLLHSGHEYLSFIALIASLFVVSGGIHINVKGEATPMANTTFLLVGAVLANFIGTTGASMVLIRPWIRMNRYRITAFHIIFFIFAVSNVGGCLTPIGDPPLFLGYLRGIPFFWVLENLYFIWFIVLTWVLGVFYVLDQRNFLRAPRKIREKETGAGEEWRFEGLHNIFFLGMIIGSVFISEPIFVRELIMLAAAILSYKTTAKSIHEKNGFNFEPIREVAILFAGIFSTMIPALEWLEHNAVKIGLSTPTHFFWGTGILSSVLDNAPTYLNFLTAAIGLFVQPDLVANVQNLIATHGASAHLLSYAHGAEVQRTFMFLERFHESLVAANHVPLSDIQVSYLLANHPIFVKAISVAAVFFGAMTYIGNGPNFLVKSIADQSKVNTPTFFGYIFKYSLPVLLPILFLTWLLFFNRVG